MRHFKRISLFLCVNLAVILILTIVSIVFGFRSYMTPYGLDYVSLAILAAFFGFGGSFISLFFSKSMAKWMHKVKVIQTPRNSEESKLFEVVSSISHNLGINMPEVGIYNSPEVNAFATGWSRNHSLVAVSSGLLQAMNSRELEGVLAHEMAHVANGDMVTMVLLQGVINTFVIFAARAIAFFVEKFLTNDEKISYLLYWVLTILFEIVFGILASMIVFAFSRHREFRADSGGAKFVGKANMIAALKRLQELTGHIDTRQKSFATMKISDKPARFGRLFSTHPSLDERIEVLQKAQIS